MVDELAPPPHDEVRPLSCRERACGDRSRGTMDDAMGCFALTQVDALTTRIMFRAKTAEHVAELARNASELARRVSVDADVVVSTFEATIRVVGGLVSAHALLLRAMRGAGVPVGLETYDGQLLDKAVDLGTRLLAAYDSPAEIPFHRVHLRNGPVRAESKTCPAAGGSAILELGLLSRLSRRAEFETAAWRAMEQLISAVDPHSGLMVGSILDVVDGSFADVMTGVGPGNDSFLEYLLKAYVVLGYDASWRHFTGLREALERATLFGSFHFDVFTRAGNVASVASVASSSTDDAHAHAEAEDGSRSCLRMFSNEHRVSSLAAFLPAVDVLAGKLARAKRGLRAFSWIAAVSGAGVLPELFHVGTRGMDNPAWPLRPELLESALYVLEADASVEPDAIRIVEGAMRVWEATHLGALTRVRAAKLTCEPAAAAVHDLRSMQLDDRFDSFAISETLKYAVMVVELALQRRGELPPPPAWLRGAMVFTTEGHPIFLDDVPPPSVQKPLGGSSRAPRELREMVCRVADMAMEATCPSGPFWLPFTTTLETRAKRWVRGRSTVEATSLVSTFAVPGDGSSPPPRQLKPLSVWNWNGKFPARLLGFAAPVVAWTHEPLLLAPVLANSTDVVCRPSVSREKMPPSSLTSAMARVHELPHFASLATQGEVFHMLGGPPITTALVLERWDPACSVERVARAARVAGFGALIVTRDGPAVLAKPFGVDFPVVWLDNVPARDLTARHSPHAVASDEVVLVRFPSDVRSSSTSSASSSMGGSVPVDGLSPLPALELDWSAVAYLVLGMWNLREVLLYARECGPRLRRVLGRGDQ